MHSMDYKDLFDSVQLIPVYREMVSQKLYVMLTQKHPLDFVIDNELNMRHYAPALLANWGSYEELQDKLGHLKDFLLMVDGDVYGSPLAAEGTTTW